MQINNILKNHFIPSKTIKIHLQKPLTLKINNRINNKQILHSSTTIKIKQ